MPGIGFPNKCEGFCCLKAPWLKVSSLLARPRTRLLPGVARGRLVPKHTQRVRRRGEDLPMAALGERREACLRAVEAALAALPTEDVVELILAQAKESNDDVNLLKKALIAYQTCVVRFALTPEAYPKALYQSAILYDKLKLPVLAQHMREELKTRCPNSSWSEKLKE